LLYECHQQLLDLVLLMLGTAGSWLCGRLMATVPDVFEQVRVQRENRQFSRCACSDGSKTEILSIEYPVSISSIQYE